MHMADALVSPAVGGIMWISSAAAIAYSVRKLKNDDVFESKKIPLMGVTGAFVFAAQMINFTIPATGSSGHIGGGLLLAALLGPSAGFLVMSVILCVQALFFADGGLLALGANIFNLGFITCFIVYPLIFKPLVSKSWNKKNILIFSIIAAVCGTILGAFCVVLQTVISGITELPFGAFASLMLPIHAVIGLIEGVVTSAVLLFIFNEQPTLLHSQYEEKTTKKHGLRNITIALVIAAVLCGGVINWFASANPDGLEWSILNTTGSTDIEAKSPVAESIGKVQEITSFMPDYNYKDAPEQQGVVNTGGTAAGIIGSALVLFFAGVIGTIAHLVKKKKIA